MDYDAHEANRKRNSYKTALDEAETALDQGHTDKAAKKYRAAADAYAELGRIRGTNHDGRVNELHEIANRAEAGDRVRRVDENDESEPADSSRVSVEDGQNFREVIENFIMQTDKTWDDVGGLQDTKTLLRESLSLGAIGSKPEAISAPNRVLLFGPPGTGKTELAKAVAGTTDATFFNVKLGNLLSKFYGESSQKVIQLFEVAKDLSPSVIFLDEIDALTQSRSSGGDDASRRVLNTLLSELSDLDDNNDEGFVFVLGATNTPWDLDFAIRRRFSHRLQVPLPDRTACEEIVRVHTTRGGVDFAGDPGAFIPGSTTVDQRDIDQPSDAIAAVCEDRGFTGSDIEVLANEAIGNMVHRVNPDLASHADGGLSSLQNETLDVDSIRPHEVQAAFESVSPSLSEEDLDRFDEWDEQFGTG